MGSQVATMLRPIDSGRTFSSCRRLTNASGGGSADRRLAAGRRIVEKSAVLDHGQVAQLKFGENTLQIAELAPSHQDHPPPGLLESMQGFDRLRVDDPVVRQGTVVVGG